jgi:hypothetical protein
MTSTVLLMFVLAGSPVLSYDATELPYFDPQGSERTALSYRSHGSGSIPRELGEKVLTEEIHEFGAKYLIALVSREYALVQEQLRLLVRERIGVAEEYDRSAGPIPKPIEERPPYSGVEYPVWPPLGEELSLFNDLAKDVHPPQEFQLTTQPYNRLESVEGFSEARIRISDGETLLGKNVTILQINRRDYSKERARFNHAMPIPLPYKENSAFTVVTDTEVALIESLRQRVPGLIIRYFLPTSRLTTSWDSSYREDALAGLRKAANDF